MPNTTWQVSGDYFESCSCDYLCPCVTSNLTVPGTKGHCDFALVFHVDHGRHGTLSLDDLSFVIVGHAPERMDKGNWKVALITDERGTPQQREALVAIGSGQAGGPMAGLAPLIGTFLGVEAKPIRFEKKGMARSVVVPGVLDEAIEGVASVANADEPLYIDNTLHPANARLALAKAVRSHLHLFGINWDDDSGRNNGLFARFDWKGE
jgi:hypothetical protein